MRKLICFFALTIGWLVQSCVQDEKSLFDKPATERVNELLSEYEALLTGEPNGWMMEYFPGDSLSVGGYTYVCTFKGGEVTLLSDVSTVHYPAGEKVTSLYRLISDQGPVLTFDTYNEIFHAFSEPLSSGDTDGYEGDYEFAILKADDHSMTLKGKKHGSIFILNRMEETGEAYIGKIQDTESKIAPMPRLRFLAGGEEFSVIKDRRILKFIYPEANGETRIETVTFIYTPTGIKLHRPLTFNGQTVQEFRLDEEEKDLVGVNAAVRFPYPTPFESLFCETQWWFDFSFDTLSGDKADMCSEMQGVLKGIYDENTRIWYGEESLTDIYIGVNGVHFVDPNADPNPYAFVFHSGNYNAVYGCHYKTGVNDTWVITPVASGFNFSYYGHFLPLVTYVGEYSPYTLAVEASAGEDPRVIKFSSVKNPAVWFRLYQRED
ncbi:hypothetical protein EZS27_005881 [termite gut metagenome]|uniref:DUF4987 domain-containing protein n=1 Tax=termite gut metagenome TaxID=433724 RepID=A0A5J4SKL0_9ZZZZ